MAAEEALTEDLEAGQTTEGQTADGQAAESEGERERSTVAFPYGDLDDAYAVAKAVHEVGGSSCDWDQLAAKLNQAATGGGFRQRALTAKTFGLITYSGGKVTLTELGLRICDPKQEKSAKVTAFLNVELYKKVYDRFKGSALPGAKGLENEMVALGVSNKQKDKARQVFQRSATQAGFFWSGQDRLVAPAINGAAERPAGGTSGLDKPPKESEGSRGGGGDGGGTDPAIQGLIRRLPKPDSDFPLEKQVKWLLAVARAFEVVYPRADDDGRFLKIEIVKEEG